jgi:hypothetical protein
MLRKKIRKGPKLAPTEVNIVSLMDILTTLLFFILMVTSFSNFSIMSASPLTSGAPQDDDKNVFALEIERRTPTRATIWLGATDGLSITNKKSFKRYMRRRFSGSPKKGYRKYLSARTPDKLLEKLSKILIKIKQSFPTENNAVVSFRDKITYQHMINTIASVRSLGESAKAFSVKNGIKSIKSRVLFPSAIIAEAKRKDQAK